MTEPLRKLPRIPSVERVLSGSEALELRQTFARPALVAAVRLVLERLRQRIRSGEQITDEELEPAVLTRQAAAVLEIWGQPGPCSLVNATGIVLHTNLGRALLAEPAVEAVIGAARSACALEYDLEGASRGERDGLVEGHLQFLTGAQAATVVNNNAAAVLLVLNSLADGRDVVVSRGELIEIGGSFRIPDIMAKSGARLCEVGTTNRTHAGDYEAAIGAGTAMLLKVHSSNYRIVGFTASVELSALCEIAASHEGIVVVEDLGSGALLDLRRWGLAEEPVVGERIAQGADLVTFSGDKLLGGPQCGLIVGRRDLIELIRRNPLRRALRCDKMTLAALQATLRLYRLDPKPELAIPTLWALSRSVEQLEALGREAEPLLRDTLGPGYRVTLEPSKAEAGSGAQPGVTIESRALVIGGEGLSPDSIARRFRASTPPIIGRIDNGRFLLDLRVIREARELVPCEP